MYYTLQRVNTETWSLEGPWGNKYLMLSNILKSIYLSWNILRDIHVDGRIILKYILKQQGLRMWTVFNWLMIKSGGVLLWQER
jgi:hypothetical protein